MVLRINKRKIGGCYEKIAADYLKINGVQIKEINYRCRLGEIDIIGCDGEYLIFVEVKYRSSKQNGMAAEAVGYGKRKVISRVAMHYLTVHYSTVDVLCRFDVVTIDGEEIRWIRNAFNLTQ